MLLCGGKRFRPALLLSVVDAYEPLLLANAMKPAFAIECLHTYSLIHDDLPSMDNATLRRGSPTLHVSYDEVTAILVGDALNTYAFELIASSSFSGETKSALVLELARNGGIGGMVLGQAIDCFFEDTKLILDELIVLHKNKTGKLIAASLSMGAIICGLGAGATQKLYDFGLRLGLFFQVRDDILDAVSTEEQSGKTVGHDTHKNSFVNLLGLEGARAYNAALTKELTDELGAMNYKLEKNLSAMLTGYFRPL
jgi:farnesyl diphosphate synthase